MSQGTSNFQSSLEIALQNLDPPQTEESTLGIGSRLAVASKVRNAAAIQEFLFGYATTEISSPLQAGLGRLYSRFPSNFREPKELLDRHTIYPLIRILEESREDARNAESQLFNSEAAGQSLRGRLSQVESLFSSKTSGGDDVAVGRPKRRPVKVCLQCLIDNLLSGHISTWRRSQLLPGSRLCDIHPSIPFFDKCPWCGSPWLLSSYVLPGSNCDCAKTHLRDDEGIHLLIAQRVDGLYSGSSNAVQADSKYHKFIYGLLNQNLNPIPTTLFAAALVMKQIENSKTMMAAHIVPFRDIGREPAFLERKYHDSRLLGMTADLDVHKISYLPVNRLLHRAASVFEGAQEFSSYLNLIAQHGLYADYSLVPLNP